MKKPTILCGYKIVARFSNRADKQAFEEMIDEAFRETTSSEKDITYLSGMTNEEMEATIAEFEDQ